MMSDETSEEGRKEKAPRAKAKRLWPRAERILGSGEWASVSYCPGGGMRKPYPYITVYLYQSRERAEEAKRIIDQTACGGGCWGERGHFVLHLEDDKERIAELNARFL